MASSIGNVACHASPFPMVVVGVEADSPIDVVGPSSTELVGSSPVNPASATLIVLAQACSLASFQMQERPFNFCASTTRVLPAMVVS